MDVVGSRGHVGRVMDVVATRCHVGGEVDAVATYPSNNKHKL